MGSLRNGGLFPKNGGGAALTRFVALYARARRAATGRAACELWGLCARPLAIEIGEGGLVSLTPGSARYKFRVMIYRIRRRVNRSC